MVYDAAQESKPLSNALLHVCERRVLAGGQAALINRLLGHLSLQHATPAPYQVWLQPLCLVAPCLSATSVCLCWLALIPLCAPLPAALALEACCTSAQRRQPAAALFPHRSFVKLCGDRAAELAFVWCR